MSLTARAALLGDAPAITAIYNEGIADRIATFETEPRTTEQIARWFDGRHPIVAVEDDGGAVVAFASCSGYRNRELLRRGRGIFGLCRASDHRGTGAGRVAIAALIDAATEAGTLEAGVPHIPGERCKPRSDGAHGISAR